jgi:hypothetical protein
MYTVYNEPNIVEDIKIKRLRMGGSYNKDGRRKDSKKVLSGNFHTTRPVGRPRIRWAGVV